MWKEAARAPFASIVFKRGIRSLGTKPRVAHEGWCKCKMACMSRWKNKTLVVEGDAQTCL